MSCKNLAKKLRVSKDELNDLGLCREKYYHAVGHGPSPGGWNCQVYQDRNDGNINIAIMFEPNGTYYWHVDEAFFDAVDASYDRGLEGDDYFAGTDVRAIQCALETFESCIEMCDLQANPKKSAMNSLKTGFNSRLPR